MYRHLEHRLAQRVLECLQRKYPGVPLPGVVVEQPPKVELGDFAIPIFPFAKPLRSAPLKIAEAIRAEIGPIEGIAEMQVAPPGYLNVKIDRGWMAAALAADQKPAAEIASGKILVEHSSINPNKAAHIGHLRNAILGDTFVRLLRSAGREVDVQNYIDNTGVQVADVVVGFTQIEKKSRYGDRGSYTPATFRLLLLGSCTLASRSGTRPTNRICKCVCRRCMPLKTARRRLPLSRN